MFKVSSDAFGMLSPMQYSTVFEVSSIPQTDKSQDDMIPKPFPLDGEGLEKSCMCRLTLSVSDARMLVTGRADMG